MRLEIHYSEDSAIYIILIMAVILSPTESYHYNLTSKIGQTSIYNSNIQRLNRPEKVKNYVISQHFTVTVLK